MYKPERINQEKWNKRKEEDEINFSNEIFFLDKRGVKGDNLFNLTLDNLGSEIRHRLVTVVTGQNVDKGMVIALCPELECFVTLIDWMGPGTNRKKERLAYYHKLNSFINSKDNNKVCKIKGNYRLKRENYSTITISWGNVEIEEKDKIFYEWERVPFLKRSAENFSYFPSPIFIPPVVSKEECISEERVLYFTSMFKLKLLENERAVLCFFYSTSPYQKETEVIIYDPKIMDQLNKNRDSIFLGLFEDKIYRWKKDYEREFVLVSLSEKLDGNEIAGHLITQRMYYNYLKNRSLKICSDEELKNKCKTLFFQIEKTYQKPVNMPFDFFIRTYLEAYFIKVDSVWYYKPYLLKDLNKEEFSEFLEYTSAPEDNKEKVLYLLKLRKKYQKYKNYLDFINIYNFYSKRTMIDLINNYNTREGLSKWRI